jgi:probable F420-dependent oxidoreductase
MYFGAICGNAAFSIRPEQLARALEERGFESAWFPEHTHIPASRKTPYPFGGDLPEVYWSMMDPFASCMAAAAATERLKVGTGICLVVEHEPIYLAKQIATIDVLSGGRILFGIGGGWNAEEMENHGTPFDRRFQLLRERVLAMKEIWTQDEASFSGEFVTFEKIWQMPKPVQAPHPPVLFGGVRPKGLKRVVEFCDGLILVDADGGESLARARVALREHADAAGRDMTTIETTVFTQAKPEVALYEGYRELGVDRVVHFVADRGDERVLKSLDAAAALIPKFA